MRYKALLAAALGLFLLVKVLDGSVIFYINQRFVWLVIVAGVILIISAQILFVQKDDGGEVGSGSLDIHQHIHEHHHDHNQGAASGGKPADLVWLLVPLLIGFLVPARPLSSGAISSRGLSLSAPLSTGMNSTTFEVSPENRTILDWVYVFNHADDPKELEGQPVRITGFVYRDHRLSEDQFFVGRFIITCCAADAMAVGLVVQSEDAGIFPESTWVSVHGKMSSIEMDGEVLPLVLGDNIESIPAPEQPYLYP